tara:strand:- start:77 stop:334 length:258 start_codon:yes stop_codon:yes gene_type:complete
LVKNNSNKIFVLLEDENISREVKILLCEYIIVLERLKELLENYIKGFANIDSKLNINISLMHILLDTCIALEEKVSDIGLSLELH